MKMKNKEKEKDYFYKISDLPTGEYQILIGGRESGKSHYEQTMLMLKFLKSVLMVYEDKGKLHLGIKPQCNEEECIDIIRWWLYD